jgi:23S rRNA (cytosine1962-C5)-methyltransferase
MVLHMQAQKDSQKDVRTIWRLKKGMDRRFRSGHPWIYSNELSQSPKGIEPGQAVALHDPGGAFIALGYGNPKSLISFRVLDRSPEAEKVMNPFSASFLVQKLQHAYSLRARAGLTQFSYRLCYGEGDFLPGLIIDRYRTAKGQVFSIQAHTAGADRMLKALPEALETFNAQIPNPLAWSQTGIIVNNDLGVRVLEGLQAEPAKVQKPLAGESLSPVRIQVQCASGGEKPVEFSVDLIGGQKTGFFLDQAVNIGIAIEKFSRSPEFVSAKGKPIRILDLCCYVGQWGTQLARAFRSRGIAVEVSAVDASQQALDFAQENMEREGAKVRTFRGDILKDLVSIDSASFDIVVCDPPALIKGRKDIPQGKHAYLQLNTQVFRVVRKGGAVISCSCSALLEEEDFAQALGKAARRNAVDVQWIGRGCQSSDHPMLMEFPEGRYLKSLFGWVAN